MLISCIGYPPPSCVGVHRRSLGACYDQSPQLEIAMSRLLKVRNYEFHVVVQPLSDGGFTYTCVEVDLSRTKKISEIRYDSHLRFETEDEAYEGGTAHARWRAKRVEQ